MANTIAQNIIACSAAYMLSLRTLVRAFRALDAGDSRTARGLYEAAEHTLWVYVTEELNDVFPKV